MEEEGFLEVKGGTEDISISPLLLSNRRNGPADRKRKEEKGIMQIPHKKETKKRKFSFSFIVP